MQFKFTNLPQCTDNTQFTPGHIFPSIKQESQLLFSHVSPWHQYSSFGNSFDYSFENCKCSKAPIAVWNVPVVVILLHNMSVHKFGVDNVQTWQAAATCSAAQQHSTLTVQIVYKLYSVQLNCTYSNYTEAAATCSAAQHHSTFTVQILYKLYSVQLNSTYSNYTEASVTGSAAQTAHHIYCTNTVQTVQCATELYWQ